MKLGNLAMDGFLVLLRTSYFEDYTNQTTYRAIGIAVHTPLQSKLLVLDVEGQIGNSLRPKSAGNTIIELRFYNLMIEDPWRLQSQRKESCAILYDETCLHIHSLRTSYCLRREECHDPGLGPVLRSMCWVIFKPTCSFPCWAEPRVSWPMSSLYMYYWMGQGAIHQWRRITESLNPLRSSSSSLSSC